MLGFVTAVFLLNSTSFPIMHMECVHTGHALRFLRSEGGWLMSVA